MKNIIILFSLMILQICGLTAAELTGINIKEPLKKTKKETILTIIGYREGDSIDSAAVDDIHQKLLKSGLFVNEDINVDLKINNDLAELELSLKEKMTTVPIPFATVSKDSLQGGLFLMNSNLAGTGDQMFLGFIAGADFQYATVSYTDKNFLAGPWDLGGRTNFFNRRSVISDSESREISEYSSLKASGGIFTQWNSGIWSLRGGIDAGALRIDDLEGVRNRTLFTASPEVSAEISTYRYGEFFPAGFKGKSGLKMDLYGDVFKTGMTLSLEGEWKMTPHPRLETEAAAEVVIYEGDGILSPSLHTPLLPSTVHGDTSVQGSLGLTAAVFDFSWAYLALPLSYHIGVFDGISGDRDLFHGPSAGISLNLKKIALPAVSFRYGWNVETSQGQFQFNLGFQ